MNTNSNTISKEDILSWVESWEITLKELSEAIANKVKKTTIWDLLDSWMTKNQINSLYTTRSYHSDRENQKIENFSSFLEDIALLKNKSSWLLEVDWREYIKTTKDLIYKVEKQIWNSYLISNPMTGEKVISSKFWYIGLIKVKNVFNTRHKDCFRIEFTNWGWGYYFLWNEPDCRNLWTFLWYDNAPTDLEQYSNTYYFSYLDKGNNAITRIVNLSNESNDDYINWIDIVRYELGDWRKMLLIKWELNATLIDADSWKVLIRDVYDIKINIDQTIMYLEEELHFIDRTFSRNNWYKIYKDN